MNSLALTGGVDQDLTAAAVQRLRGFREQVFGCLPRRGDALFELIDALLAAESMPSLPHLSLQPAHRRGWGSVYAALALGELDADRLADVLTGQVPQVAQPVFAGPGLLLLTDPALGRSADRGRLVLLVDRPARLRLRLVDRSGRCASGAGG